jgi:hypothetical protein
MPNRLISKLLVGGQQANDSYIQECKHNKVFATSDEEEEEEEDYLEMLLCNLLFNVRCFNPFALPSSDLFI